MGVNDAPVNIHWCQTVTFSSPFAQNMGAFSHNTVYERARSFYAAIPCDLSDTNMLSMPDIISLCAVVSYKTYKLDIKCGKPLTAI